MVFDGRFRIDQWIAEGGFAVVYKACQVALDRRVALKILKPRRGHDDAARAEFREKFASEARTIARLRHPHIVDVYDFSVSPLPSGEPAAWMALEWLEGETLATTLARRRAEGKKGMAPLEALAFVRPVLQALAHAHKHGIVHRDIKPANIMVTPTAHGPALRVLDFGIAKIMADDSPPNTGQTRTESSPAFSPAYAAPEQVAFSRTGPWTDVHALGLILTELMTDEAPFTSSDPELHMFEQVMLKDRPTPGRKRREVGVFEPIVAKAVALSPRDRWKNAGELLKALDDAAAGGALARSAARAAAPATRWRRRLPLLAAASLAAAGIGWLATGIGRTSRPASPPVPQVGGAAIVNVPAPPPSPAAPRATEAPQPIEPAGASAAVTVRHRPRPRPPGHPQGQVPAPAAPKDLFDDIR
jgi:serine/threonine-protein kinase